MAKIVRLTPDLYIAHQPEPADFQRLRELGVRSVINNRPDDEDGPPYPPAEEARRLAAEQGLDYGHMPVQGPDFRDPDLGRRFAELMDSLPKPVVAHCRSGTRSVALWALANADKMPLEEIMAKAAEAGVDLARLRQLIQARRAPAGKPGAD